MRQYTDNTDSVYLFKLNVYVNKRIPMCSYFNESSFILFSKMLHKTLFIGQKSGKIVLFVEDSPVQPIRRTFGVLRASTSGFCHKISGVPREMDEGIIKTKNQNYQRCLIHLFLVKLYKHEQKPSAILLNTLFNLDNDKRKRNAI